MSSCRATNAKAYEAAKATYSPPVFVAGPIVDEAKVTTTAGVYRLSGDGAAWAIVEAKTR